MSFFQDLRYAIRLLVKDKWFTLVAATALALGIGVNNTVFTFVNAVLIRGLPFDDPSGDRLRGWMGIDRATFYGNLAIAQQRAKDIVSSQFNFDPGDLAFIATNAIHTDHDQLMTGSAGASYLWQQTRFSIDLLAALKQFPLLDRQADRLGPLRLKGRRAPTFRAAEGG